MNPGTSFSPMPFPLVQQKEIPESGTFEQSSQLNRLSHVVRGAKFPVIVVGSGVSNLSFGRPSHATAFTARQDAENLRLTDLKKDPYSFWQHFRTARASVGRVQSNVAQQAIANFAVRRHAGLVIDLNTDGLLEKLTLERMLPLRGSIWRNRCEHCGTTKADTNEKFTDSDGFYLPPPTCPVCKKTECPDVLLRDELIDLRYEEPLAHAKMALVEADVIVLAGVAFPQCPESLHPILRPLTTSRNGRGAIAGKFTIEVAAEKQAFLSDSHLIGKLGYLIPQLLAP